MPIEIREITIKTEISSRGKQNPALKEKELSTLKKQLLEECKRIISLNVKKAGYKR